MKNILTIMLLMLYATFSIGLNIAVHTCGGESEALLATTKIEDPCGCADETPANKCCSTVITTVQLDDTQKASISSIVDQLIVVDARPTDASFIQKHHDSGFAFHYLSSFSPPPKCDLCIVNSVFLI